MFYIIKYQTRDAEGFAVVIIQSDSRKNVRLKAEDEGYRNIISIRKCRNQQNPI